MAPVDGRDMGVKNTALPMDSSQEFSQVLEGLLNCEDSASQQEDLAVDPDLLLLSGCMGVMVPMTVNMLPELSVQQAQEQEEINLSLSGPKPEPLAMTGILDSQPVTMEQADPLLNANEDLSFSHELARADQSMTDTLPDLEGKGAEMNSQDKLTAVPAGAVDARDPVFPASEALPDQLLMTETAQNKDPAPWEAVSPAQADWTVAHTASREEVSAAIPVKNEEDAAETAQVTNKNAVSMAVNALSDENNQTANRLSCEQEDGAVLTTGRKILARINDSVSSIHNPGVSDMQFDFYHFLLDDNAKAVANPISMAEETPASPEPQAIAVQEQVIRHISHSIKNGKQELVVELQPEFLGKVNIKLVSGKDGIQARVRASNSEVREVLELSLSQIQETLKSQGIEITHFDLAGFEENIYSGLPSYNESRNQQDRGDGRRHYPGYFSGKQEDAGEDLLIEDVPFGRINRLA